MAPLDGGGGSLDPVTLAGLLVIGAIAFAHRRRFATRRPSYRSIPPAKTTNSAFFRTFSALRTD
ncbi:MprA protease, GlyGly-CTERM protein-sorting domain-containing form [Pseudomonas sp. MPR-R2A5]|nr:MprA protease, GlyGly-CTERM protein-sorting domain-containing form [Pseudomonas sp. MPR-R2A5]